MTIGGWICFAFFAVLAIGTGVVLTVEGDSWQNTLCVWLVVVVVLSVIYFGMTWYFQNTASGQRALVDQQSNLANGLERTVTVYTADGRILAQYTGRIDLEANSGGYIKFDYEGKRYIYYNCFVESIAEIGGGR